MRTTTDVTTFLRLVSGFGCGWAEQHPDSSWPSSGIDVSFLTTHKSSSDIEYNNSYMSFVKRPPLPNG